MNISFSIWAISIYFDSNISQNLLNKEKLPMEIREAVSFIKGMFWIRMIPLFVITYFFSLICTINFAMIVASCFGMTTNDNNQIINLVIDSKKKLIKITGI